MSSFGCKSVLRDAIVTGNIWFPDAESMWSYCKQHFADDSTKSYHLIDPEVTRLLRDGHKLAGCMQFHMTAVDHQGDFTTYTVHCRGK